MSCSGRLQVQLRLKGRRVLIKLETGKGANWKMLEVGSTDELCRADWWPRLHWGRRSAASWDPLGLSSARLVDKGRVRLKALSAVTKCCGTLRFRFPSGGQDVM